MRPRRWAVLAVTAVVAACGGDGDTSGDGAKPAAPPPTTTPTDNVPPPRDDARDLEGGAMTLRISAGASRILEYAGVRITAVGEGVGRGRELTFPITGGRLSVAPARGRVDLAGGLRISARGDHVDATDLRLDPAEEVVTAAIDGRRVPLLRFKLRYPQALPAAGDPFTANGTVSVVGDRALERLGSEFDLEILRTGLPLGSLRVTAR